jgi:hypothetical protein
MAAEMDDSATQMKDLGEKYAAQLLEIDPGVRALIALGGESGRSEEDKQAVCLMSSSIKQLVENSRENTVAIKEFAESVKGPAAQFRDLRPVLGTIQTGLRSVLDAQTILDEWGRLIDESPLDCSDTPIPQSITPAP